MSFSKFQVAYLVDELLDGTVPFSLLVHVSVLTVRGFIQLKLKLHYLTESIDQINAVASVVVGESTIFIVNFHDKWWLLTKQKNDAYK